MDLHNKVCGFGRFPRLTCRELAATQPSYVKWLFAQDWFARDHPDIYVYMDTLGLRPTDIPRVNTSLNSSSNLSLSESLKRTTRLRSPERSLSSPSLSIDNSGDAIEKPMNENDMIALFVNYENQIALFENILGDNSIYLLHKIIFEDVSGFPLVLIVDQRERGNAFWNKTKRCVLLVNFQVVLGDDYRTVLSRLRSQRNSYIFGNTDSTIDESNIKVVHLIQSYVGKIPFDIVQKMYGDIIVDKM